MWIFLKRTVGTTCIHLGVAMGKDKHVYPEKSRVRVRVYYPFT